MMFDRYHLRLLVKCLSFCANNPLFKAGPEEFVAIGDIMTMIKGEISRS
jgi:hypothetical protein